MLRKICSMLLSLAMTVGLVSALSGTAHAQNYRVIDWHISNITERGSEHERRYFNLIDAIHQNSYGNRIDMQGVRQTTTEHRLIQVRVLDTGDRHLASIYLWADNLYVAGFYAPGPNVHHVFRDRVEEFQQALGLDHAARQMNSNGNYNALPGGNQRENLVLEPESIYHAMQVLNSADHYTDEVGRAMLVSIQIFSEAARFGLIFDRVRGNIRNWTHTNLGPGYAALENQWGGISSFANLVGLNGHEGQIQVLGQIVTSLVALRQVLGFVELNGSQSRL
ncbi:ribosome-inactivating family protein [Streptomyces triculaminicus]|uniref:ribosome-inactivating family protein n=1 Tax=Streptomyces triculaminicus TaxID=2816232 RepID=UPI0037D432B8